MPADAPPDPAGFGTALIPLPPVPPAAPQPRDAGGADDAPLGADPATVGRWFAAALNPGKTAADGSLAAERDAARGYAKLARAENTRRAYGAAVKAWCGWCRRHGLTALPGCGADVAAFMASERDRGLAAATLVLRRAAIRTLHRLAGCPVPTDDACVAETMAGIQRSAARAARPRQKKAATVQVLRLLLRPLGDTLPELRDRALLLVGFAGALRRSELAGIRLDALANDPRGLLLTLAASKGSQAAAVTVPLPYGDTELCPVRALQRWLDAAGITDGPVFRRIWRPPGSQAPALPGAPPGAPPALPARPRIGSEALSDRAVALIIQARAAAAGFGRLELGGHSLKRGAITTGMQQGVHPARLKRLGRHKSYDTLGDYTEFGDPFDQHPLHGVL